MLKTDTITKTVLHEVFITSADLKRKFDLPMAADVSVRVPGGGDWSNKDLDIDNGNSVVRVAWTTTEVRHEEE